MRTARQLVVLLAMFAVIGGCETMQTGGGPPEPTPPWTELAEGHNARLDRLVDVYSRGVVEFTWFGEDGERHDEPQVHVSLFIRLPASSAMRFEKLGETLLWLGSDADRFWLFNLLDDDDRVLYAAPHGAPIEVAGYPIGFEPLGMRDLLGLTPLPETGEVDYDAGLDAWVMTAAVREQTMRIALARSTRLPVRIELLAADGSIEAESTLDRYVGVPIDGVARGLHPKFPTLVDMVEHLQGTTLKLALDEPSDDTIDRVFDLDLVTQALRPHRVLSASAGD